MDEKFLISYIPKYTQKNIAAKKIIFSQDEPADSVFYIVHGLVRTYRLNEDGQEITLTLKGRGEIIGLYSILLDNIHKSSAETIQDTSLIIWRRKDFYFSVQKTPDFAFHLLNYLANQTRQEHKYITRITTDDLKSKTWKTLRRIAKLSKTDKVNLSQESIANIVGATRPRVTEILHKLEYNKKIKINRGSIQVFP